jgi:sugar transferase EpsL
MMSRKRIFDLLLAVPAVLICAPAMAVIALLTRLSQGKDIFFHQIRPGLQEKPFTMLKFRTMSNRQGDGGRLLPDEQRITPFGQFLRSTSLDELPELFNVLKGEMSLVGPRPLLMRYLQRYTPEQMRRHEVRPGITGWAQVNGRNAISWEEKFKLDVWYVDNQSLELDIKIIALTLLKILKREGISAAGHATMSEFMGPERVSSADWSL